MNCQDVRAALLAGDTSEAISSHLHGCVECRRAISDIESDRTDLASDSLWAEPPAGLGDSIVAAITAADHPRAESTNSIRAIPSRRFTGRSVALMFGSVAAALVLIVGAFAMLSRTPAPDWQAAMAGDTTSATGVVAGWNVGDGTRVVLEAADLGSAPEGFVYQLWFSRASGDVSAGTFTDPSYVELSVGVSRKDFPAVWIALQPIGTDAASSGQALLWTSDT
ncbi:MAG: anti-sigma factor domain-containing protein [Acidimicrobiia bacterium]